MFLIVGLRRWIKSNSPLGLACDCASRAKDNLVDSPGGIHILFNNELRCLWPIVQSFYLIFCQFLWHLKAFLLRGGGAGSRLRRSSTASVRCVCSKNLSRKDAHDEYHTTETAYGLQNGKFPKMVGSSCRNQRESNHLHKRSLHHRSASTVRA